MTDSKYAHLPGIAYDQPDVYETCDLPEADQAPAIEEENEDIDRIVINASDAISKFKGKYLNANKVDFSERIGRTLKTGYDARSGNWELAADGEVETPTQKANRLRAEFNELLMEIDALKPAERDESHSNITKQVEQSLKMLSDLKLEKSVGGEIVNNLSDPQGTQLRKMMQLLDDFKESTGKTSKDNLETNELLYKLKFRPEKAKYLQTARVAELEHRLHQLETLIGANQPEKLQRLAKTTSGSLVEATQTLDARCALLESGQLDHIEGRLNALAQTMETIAQKRTATEVDADVEQHVNDLLAYVTTHKAKSQNAEDAELIVMITELNGLIKKMREISSPPDVEKEQKINELYDFVKKTESIVGTQPQVLERLTALDAFHREALEFKTSLTQLETIQSQLSSGVKNNKALLQGVQESFAMNLDMTTKMIEQLDQKVSKLREKK